MGNFTRDEYDAAVAALKNLGNPYVTRRDAMIATAALDGTSEMNAVLKVRHVVGHTMTGSLNAAKWANIARAAVLRGM